MSAVREMAPSTSGALAARRGPTLREGKDSAQGGRSRERQTDQSPSCARMWQPTTWSLGSRERENISVVGSTRSLTCQRFNRSQRPMIHFHRHAKRLTGISEFMPTRRTPSSTRAPTGMSTGPVRSDVGVRRINPRTFDRASSLASDVRGERSARFGRARGAMVWLRSRSAERTT